MNTKEFNDNNRKYFFFFFDKIEPKILKIFDKNVVFYFS